MSSRSSSKELSCVSSREVYQAVLEEHLEIKKGFSETGHLYPVSTEPHCKWFKGSRERGLRGDLAA